MVRNSCEYLYNIRFTILNLPMGLDELNEVCDVDEREGGGCCGRLK